MNSTERFAMGRQWIGLLSILLVLASNSFSQQTWPQERDSLIKLASMNCIQGDLEKGEEILKHLEVRGWEKKDTVSVIRGMTGRMNIHLHEEGFLEEMLEKVKPLIFAAGRLEDFTEYYIDRANVFRLRGDFQNQIAHVDTALSYALKSMDTTDIGLCYYELAEAYQVVEKYRSALEMNVKGRVYFEEGGNFFYVAHSWANEAICFAGLEVYDSAIVAMEESIDIFDKMGADDFVAFNEGYIGKFYLDAGNLGKARENLEKAKENLFGSGDYLVSDAAFNVLWDWLAELYLATGELGKAKEAALLSYELADSFGQLSNRPAALETLLNIVLAEQEEIQGYFQNYVKDQKQLYEEQNSRAVLEYERKYKAEEAEKKVLVLDKAAKEAELRAQNNRFLIFLVLSLALLAGLVVALLTIRSRFRSRQQINELNRKALQLQINPHFFFNVLNSINHYIMQNDQKAANFYLARFAKLMRLSLENSQFDKVEVGQEIDLVEAYLQLEKLRRDSFDFEMKCPEDLREYKIPPLMVQPFVENSVVHAFPDELPHRGKITVEVSQEQGFLCLDISDNGIGIDPNQEVAETEGKTSLAIRILKERLAAYGKRKGEIVFAKADPAKSEGPGTRVLVRIPTSD